MSPGLVMSDLERAIYASAYTRKFEKDLGDPLGATLTMINRAAQQASEYAWRLVMAHRPTATGAAYSPPCPPRSQ